MKETQPKKQNNETLEDGPLKMFTYEVESNGDLIVIDGPDKESLAALGGKICFELTGLESKASQEAILRDPYRVKPDGIYSVGLEGGKLKVALMQDKWGIEGERQFIRNIVERLVA